ncbi:MAG: cytochrome c3 family protein [Bacteroidota bacterium]
MKLMKVLTMALFYLLISPFISKNNLDIYSSGIEGTHHDFTRSPLNYDEICKVCHTPHNANMEIPNSPLWNHEITQATYELYNSPTIDAAIGQPNGDSKLCLSCHDGTVAYDSFGGNTGTKYLSWDWQMGNIGVDLTHEHPISFTYNTALAEADGELADPSSTPSGLGGTIAEDMLDNGQMQCSTCHDVHVERKTVDGCNGCHRVPGREPSLSIRIANENSALCLTCHKK